MTKTMKAWVLGDPGQLSLVDKPVPLPAVAEVLIRIDAVAICATDLEVIAHGPPAVVGGEPPFNRNFTPGHEYMGTIVGLGPTVDEFVIGERVAVEVHAGCGRCERCRQGMYTSCLNYGRNYGEFNKGHRANGFTTDGGFAQYVVNHVNTVVRVPEHLSDEVATLIVTAGTATYGLDVLGGLVAGESLVVTGAGPIGLSAVTVGKALGASPVILTDIVDSRLAVGTQVGADIVINAAREPVVDSVRKLTNGRGVDLVFECSGAPNAVTEAVYMLKRGRPCLSGRLLTAARPGGCGPHRDQQHLSIRDTRRRPERGPACGVAHRAEEARPVAAPHAHVRIRRAANRDPLLQGQGRRGDQGRHQAAGVS
jgi:L-iditol 2-dehydrogenase